MGCNGIALVDGRPLLRDWVPLLMVAVQEACPCLNCMQAGTHSWRTKERHLGGICMAHAWMCSGIALPQAVRPSEAARSDVHGWCICGNSDWVSTSISPVRGANVGIRSCVHVGRGCRMCMPA